VRGIHRTHEIEELRPHGREPVDLFFVHGEEHTFLRGDEGGVEEGDVVVVEAEEGPVDGVGYGFAVREGGEALWVGHFDGCW